MVSDDNEDDFAGRKEENLHIPQVANVRNKAGDKTLSPFLLKHRRSREKCHSGVVYSSQNRNTCTCHQVRQTLQDYFPIHKRKLIIRTQDVPQGKHELFPNENGTQHSHI